jgi:sec-independent protein translocase protein TatA
MALGETEILLIVVVLIVLFGASQIPKFARSLGQAKGEFSRAKRDFDNEVARAETGTGSATPVASGAAATPSEDQVRATARSLGIEEKGRGLDEVKRLIQQKLA